MNMKFDKCFYESKSETYHKTLVSAKAIGVSSPYVCRVWLKDGKVAGSELVYAYGESICSIKNADKYIEEKIHRP